MNIASTTLPANPGTTVPAPVPPSVLPLAALAPPSATLEPLATLARDIDRFAEAMTARWSGGFAPSSLLQAWSDWVIHSAFSPSRPIVLAVKAERKWARFLDLVLRSIADPEHPQPAILPLAGDRRFADPAWSRPPYNIWYQGFLFTQQWWHNATTGVTGMTRHHELVVNFVARQLLDVWSPSNWLATNPVVLDRTVETHGFNLWRGALNFAEDAMSIAMTGKPAAPEGLEDFRPGTTVALTPGKVVYRNRLIELIQYSPTTDRVHPEPVLIVPAWIMKYYILDLEPQNSLVRYLVDAGYTVFAISWHNPGEDDSDIHFDDYRSQGFNAAMDAVAAIVGEAKVHVAGYCLGGTLATIGTASMARDGNERVASLTLLAAQTDFTEPGELALFISEAQVDFLSSMMWARGYLDSGHMGGAFQLLRSNDLVWSRYVQAYLMGEREEASALTAWNADGTRLPAAMHGEYLRSLYLSNALVEGHLLVNGRPIALTDIDVPIFAVGAERDHVAPWRSVYKISLLADTEVTFALASGGHNVGIVAEPGRPRIHHRLATHRPQDVYVDPDQWEASVPKREGSWWESWAAWLGERSGEPVPPPPMGKALADAPGRYVFE